MTDDKPKVNYRLATNDHSRGYLLEAGTVIGDDTRYPLLPSDPGKHMIPLTEAAQASYDAKAEKMGKLQW